MTDIRLTRSSVQHRSNLTGRPGRGAVRKCRSAPNKGRRRAPCSGGTSNRSYAASKYVCRSNRCELSFVAA